MKRISGNPGIRDLGTRISGYPDFLVPDNLITRYPNQKGFGLVILVALIAISGILVGSTALLMSNSTRQMQLKIDQSKAYYLAQAGIMRAIYNWRISNATDTSRRYAQLNTTVTGNQIFKTSGGTLANMTQANFAYFSFDEGGTSNADWNPTSRLRRWTIRNIHTNVAGTSDGIIFKQVKISWTPSGAETLTEISLNNRKTSGSFANGSTVTLSGTVAQRTLAANSAWTGNNNYFQWSGVPPDPITVTVQWIFNDDSTTKDSQTHSVIYWDGCKSAANCDGLGTEFGRRVMHTFAIMSTGQVNQSGGKAFKVLQTVKATVSGTPASGVEIIDWQKVDKNIP